ncbi:MAG TPA: TonB-dependent receptor, partial [Rhizobium sp.]
GAESPVATYVDGVYYGSVSSTLLSLSDVQSIDVLKGPQGTLFGRNATGGVIQINTRSPDHDPEADVEVGYGNYDTTAAKAYLGGRVSSSIAANLAVSYDHQGDGYGTNLYNGDDINKSRDFSARTKLLLQPLEGLKITLSGDYSSNRGSEGIAFRPVYGTLPEFGPAFTGGFQDIDSSTQPFVDLKQWGGSLRIDYDASAVKFVSITALRREHFQSSNDADMSALPAATTDTDAKTKQFSQEFQILSARQSPISWVLGAYFFNNDGKDNPVVLSGLAYAPFNSLDFVAQQKASSQSVFGQVTVKLDSLTHLTGGLRYTREKRTFLADQYGLYGAQNAVVPIGSVDTDHVFEKLTWRLSIDRQIVSNTMVYASYNRGFKSGLYNISSLSTTPIKPEVLDAYEVGSKSTLFGGRLRANSAFFYYDYKDLQIPQYIDGVQYLRNAAAAKIYGVDADLELRVTKSLRFTAGAEWLHARYKSFQDSPYASPLSTGGNAISSREASGNDIMLSPKLTLSVAADYTVDLGNSKLNADVTYYYNDGWYANPDNVLRQPSYSQVGGQLKWIPDNGAFSIAVWGKNLTNAKSAQYLSAVAAGDVTAVSPPRTFGVTLAAKIK